MKNLYKIIALNFLAIMQNQISASSPSFKHIPAHRKFTTKSSSSSTCKPKMSAIPEPAQAQSSAQATAHESRFEEFTRYGILAGVLNVFGIRPER